MSVPGPRPLFLVAYIAPDVANDLDSSCLAYPPIFECDGDGLLVLFRGDAGLCSAPHPSNHSGHLLLLLLKLFWTSVA